MFITKCKSLRVAVLASAALLLGGLALQAVVVLFSGETLSFLALAAMTVGFYAVLASPLLFLGALAIALLLPAATRQECMH
jgi:hypothetical protein